MASETYARVIDYGVDRVSMDALTSTHVKYMSSLFSTDEVVRASLDGYPGSALNFVEEWVNRAHYLAPYEYRAARDEGITNEEFASAPRSVVKRAYAFLDPGYRYGAHTPDDVKYINSFLEVSQMSRADLVRFWSQTPNLDLPEITNAIKDGMTPQQIVEAPADWIKSFYGN